jgi:flagellar basal body-associated protein FliL
MYLVASKKGIAHLVLILVVGVLVVAFWVLIFKFVLKGKLPFLKKEEPKVELKTEYGNPFNKETQYVNPFDEFKNPFAQVR